MKLKNTGEIKTFGSQYGVWKTEFESMALKTVTKLNLSNAPLSIEMQRATVADQMVIKVLTPMAVSKGVHRCYRNFNKSERKFQRKKNIKNFKIYCKRKHIRSVKTSGTTFKDDNQIVAYEDKKKGVNP
jgi:recombinational DNA repair protein RecT